MRLLCLAGEIATGKTTLANGLVAALPHATRVGFGDVVRRRVADAGLGPSRTNLQDMGERLIAQGWSEFVALLAAEVKIDPGVLVVDGIRHVAALHALRAQFLHRRIALVYLDSADQEQQTRLAERGENPASLAHPVERDLSAVRDLAGLVLPADEPTARQVTKVLAWLEAR